MLNQHICQEFKGGLTSEKSINKIDLGTTDNRLMENKRKNYTVQKKHLGKSSTLFYGKNI